MELINDILIRMNILLMTSDVFYIGRSILSSFLTVIFYTFIFVKDEMHVDFLHNQRNTNICMAFSKCLVGTPCHVYISFAKDACNMKSDLAIQVG